MVQHAFIKGIFDHQLVEQVVKSYQETAHNKGIALEQWCPTK
jgi:hypothetical protein